MNKLTVALFFVLLYNGSLSAQAGWNESYDFNSGINQFKTILVDNDTIVFVGYANTPDSPFIKSALVGRIDSNGQTINYEIFEDSLGDILDVGGNLVKNKADQYAFLTGVLFRNSDALYVFDSNLSLHTVFEFKDTLNLTVFYKGLISLSDGYLLAGIVQRPNHKYDAFARRIDNEGNTLWFHYYGQYEQDDIMLGITQLNDSLFAITGALS